MKRVLSVICAAIILCSCVSKSRYNSDISDLEYQVQELEDEKDELGERVEELEEQVGTLEDIVERAKTMCILWDDDSYMALRVLNEY